MYIPLPKMHNEGMLDPEENTRNLVPMDKLGDLAPADTKDKLGDLVPTDTKDKLGDLAPTDTKDNFAPIGETRLDLEKE